MNKYRKGKHGLYILKKEDIELEAECLLSKYYCDCLKKPSVTPIENIIEKVGLNIEYKQISKNSEILGAFVFNEGCLNVYDSGKKETRLFKEKTIIIDTNLVNNDDKRLMFTYGHELGHYIIQYDIFHINNDQISLFDTNEADKKIATICNRNFITSESKKELITKEDWQEWQANYFSSCILIPKKTLKIALTCYLDNYNMMEQEKVLDKLEKYNLGILIKKLSEIYNVSQEMMKNRLCDLNYLS